MDATQRSNIPDSLLYPSTEWTRLAVSRAPLPRPRRIRRDWPLALLIAAVAAYVTYSAVSPHLHSPPQVSEGVTVRFLVTKVPYLAAAFAALAIWRPWPAFLGILLLTPLWDAGQVSYYTNDFQVVLQTIFVLALGVGCLVTRGRRRAAAPAALPLEEPQEEPEDGEWDGTAGPGFLRRVAAALTVERVAAVAVVAFVALAIASTSNSPDFVQSRLVLVHGLLEPIGMGLILLALRPNRLDLALVAVVLGVSAAIGCMLSIVQTVPDATSLAMMQAQRLHFALLTYNNVGLLGEVLAMAVPLLLGALVARRSLRLSASTSILLLVALAACIAGLFLTFSKSAWLATAIAAGLLMVLVARSWRSRAAIVVSAGLISTMVIPWPALVLQFTPQLATAYRTAMVRIVGQSRFDSWNPATVAGQGSVTFRVGAVEAGLHMAVDHPLLGVGLNQYHRYYVSGYAVPPYDGRINHAHSIWPELAAELGFPAMALVVLIYAAALLALWRVYRDPPDGATRLMAATFIAAIVAWLIVASAFGSDIYRPARNMSSEVVMMAVLTAAAFALARYSRAASARRAAIRR